MSRDPTKFTANPGYVVAQLAKALTTGREHNDPETRARAHAKVARWASVFEGMLRSDLSVGSRAPVAGLPPWVTLEVLKGGFATGQALAGGPLQAHEVSLANALGTGAQGRERAAINLHYLSEQGQEELRAMLASGRYRVQLPEEGALLVLAWLLAHGHTEHASNLLDALAPYIDRLRFYPVPADTPLPPSAVVRLQSVGEVLRSLRAVRTSPRVECMNEALRFWGPLSDRVVSLWLETVEGPAPSVRQGPDGKPLRRPDGNFEVEGGYPGKRFPEGWRERAQTLLDEYARVRKDHPLSRKPERPRESFARLRGYLKECLASRDGVLPARDLAAIRRLLAGILARRGAPGSDKHRALREAQARMAAKPTQRELTNVLVRRLGGLPADQGLTSIDELMAPVHEFETNSTGVPAGCALPAHLRNKLLRCLEAPVEVLIELGVIPSGEVLARVVPQITSQVKAAGLVDRELQLLYGAIYAAFRRRRSLLLLDLSSQVRIEELPWVEAIEAFRSNDLGAKERSRQTLEQLVVLAITSFPYAILPNKLLQELRALSSAAGLDLPLVDELAADIFMGTFSTKFLEAAQRAARLLRGTLYERYYGLPYDRVLALQDGTKHYGTLVSPGFATLCAELARVSTSKVWAPARKGSIIEQEQILTTHNLAVLFEALDLVRSLGSRLPELSRRCFAWVCTQQQLRVADWQSRLRLVKNTAYAWRQMIFYLSLVSRGDLEEFLQWARRYLAEQREVFVARFAPAMEGLEAVVRGESFDHEGRIGSGRRLLGWSVGKHWLMA